MKKYTVHGKFEGSVSIEVEAKSAEDAFEKAYEEFGGISGYVGNGGIDKVVGVSGRNESIDCDYAEVEWKRPEEVGEDEKE